MKKTIVWTLAVALAIFILTGCFFVIKFSSFVKPGVHTLGNYAHIDLQKNCYFISNDGKTVTGQSTFTIVGYLNDVAGNESGLFEGHMSVAQHPISFEKGYRSHVGDIGKDFISLTCQGAVLDDPTFDTYYIVQILRDDPNVIAVTVFSGDEYTTAVCGNTEAEAITNYQLYLDSVRK